VISKVLGSNEKVDSMSGVCDSKPILDAWHFARIRRNATQLRIMQDFFVMDCVQHIDDSSTYYAAFGDCNPQNAEFWTDEE
jgi:hypothetical protein